MTVAKRNVIGLLAGAVLALLVISTPASPQGAETGGMTGVVKDSKGAAVPDAAVEIYNEDTGTLARSLKTTSDGSYTVTLLPPGSYRVEVKVGGFKKYRAVGVPVRVTEVTRHDVALELGSVSETVVVEATATLINTANSTTGQPVDPHTLRSLPLASPNYLFLLTLSTGTAGEMPDVRSAGRGNIDINVNGQRTTNNGVTIEGINVNDFNLSHFDTVPLPNPSAIEEFKVATSLYDASQGSKGGGAVALVLKSGTKNLHGEAYWAHRNDALNANEWFNNKAGVPRGRLLQNVFGASGSGPAWGLGGFWFGNYQGVRGLNGIDPNGAVTRPTIPDLRPSQAADGTVSAASLATQFGLDPTKIDPVAVNILNLKSGFYGGTFLVPRVGQTGCLTTTCAFNKVATVRDDQYTVSYDRPMRGSKDKFAVRWFFDDGTAAKPLATAGTLAFPSASVQDNRFLSVSHTAQITSRQLNEFRFGFTRFNSSFLPTDLVSLADVGATRPNKSEVPGLYFISISGLFSLGTGVNDERGTIANTFYWGDTWSMVKGRHTLRAGAEISRYQLNRFNRFSVRGSLTFAGTSTPSFTGFQNFLQGRATSLQSAGGDPQRYFRSTDVSGFFQDDWRIFSRLTINLGLRWEGLEFSRELLNRLGNYDVALLMLSPQKNPFVFPADTNIGGFTGTPGVTGCTLNNCFPKKNFAPRVGLAWDLFGNHKTIVRAGYGIYYQRLSNQNILQTNLSPPFNVQNIDSRPTGVDSNGNPAGLANPFPNLPPASLINAAVIPQLAVFAGLRCVTGPCTTPLDPNQSNVGPIFVNQSGVACSGFGGTAQNCVINLASFTAPPRDLRTPYTQQWNLTVQREFGHGWAVEVGYVGSHYVGGLGIYNPFVRLASPTSPITVTDSGGNSYTITNNTTANEPLRDAFLGLSRAKGARFSGNVGFAIYHSGQVTLSHRFQGGLYFQAAYTWSKVIDNVSGSQSTDELNITRNGQGGANLFDLGNIHPQLNRALGDFDRPHRFIVSYAWDIPIRKSGILGSQAFQGWTISGIVTYQSGLPFSITDPNGGGAFGSGGLSSPLLVCPPTSQQDPSLPMCTPGTITTVQQIATLNGSVQNNLAHWVNPNFLSINPDLGGAGTTNYGNVPRNAFRGPFQQNWDFSVAKRFHIAERHTFQFRADFFNLFNHPAFQSPAFVAIDSKPATGAAAGSRATFGQIKATVIPARIIQFGLRYAF